MKSSITVELNEKFHYCGIMSKCRSFHISINEMLLYKLLGKNNNTELYYSLSNFGITEFQ